MVRVVLALCVLALAAPLMPSAHAIESVSAANERRQREAMEALNQGIGLLNTQKSKEAIAPLTKAIESNKLGAENMVVAKFARAMAQIQTDDCQNAMKDLDAVSEAKAADGQYHYLRFVCLEKVGDKINAAAALDKAIELSPDRPEYIRTRCVASINAKNLEKAMPDCEKVVAANPDDWAIWLAIAQGSEIQGHKDKALEGYRKVVALQPDNQSAKEGLQRLGAK